jgi:hypothetical protein
MGSGADDLNAASALTTAAANGAEPTWRGGGEEGAALLLAVVLLLHTHGSRDCGWSREYRTGATISESKGSAVCMYCAPSAESVLNTEDGVVAKEAKRVLGLPG